MSAANLSWDESWVSEDARLYGEDAWAHHDLAVTADQRIVGFRSGTNSFWFLDRDGRPAGEWECDLREGHGITIVGEAGAEELWATDPEITFARRPDGVQVGVWAKQHGRVVAFDLDGNRLAELPTPSHPAYGGEEIYRPTAVEIESAGDGDVWIADGYGAKLVHKLSREGETLLTLDGTEGAGRFDCPHSILIDRRRPDAPELYVTDQAKHLIAVYDLEGNFLRSVEEGVRSPSGMAIRGEELVVAELRGRVTILDGEDRAVQRIGDDPDAAARPGWPNALHPDGHTVQPDFVPGRFNAPHGTAVDAAGTIYVVEWVLDGRCVRLS